MTLGTLYYQTQAGEPNRTRVALSLSLVKYFKLDVKLSGPDEYYPSEFYKRVVPCFRFADGTPLGESIDIDLLLLEQVENYGGLLGDASNKTRALVVQWMLFFNYEFMGNAVPPFLMLAGRQPFDKTVYDKLLNNLRTSVLPFLEKRLAATGYVVGDKISIADLYGLQMFFRPLGSFYDATWRAEFPNIWTWWQTVSKSPVWDGYWKDLKPIEKTSLPEK